MDDLIGVMQSLHVGRRFRYPPPLGSTDLVWASCDDDDLVNTLAFLQEHLQFEMQA